MIHVNVWSQDLDSGVSISYKGCRKAPRYCHEVEIAFANGDAISIWATDLQKILDLFKLALETTENAMKSTKEFDSD